jgi:hypothetical protein
MMFARRRREVVLLPFSPVCFFLHFSVPFLFLGPEIFIDFILTIALAADNLTCIALEESSPEEIQQDFIRLKEASDCIFIAGNIWDFVYILKNEEEGKELLCE